jgi:uncharacterized protein (DUF488 family)
MDLGGRSPARQRLAHVVATVWTIGHSTHEAAEFAQLLGAHGVELLVDVRRYPGSRRVPWTATDRIGRELGIRYVHLPALGGRRRPRPDSPNGFWLNDGFRGYADHMSSEEFAGGLADLLSAASEQRVAVMCAEAPWWRCHRRLLSDALVVRGLDVSHIDARGQTEPHRLTASAVVAGTEIVYPPAQGTLDDAAKPGAAGRAGAGAVRSAPPRSSRDS